MRRGAPARTCAGARVVVSRYTPAVGASGVTLQENKPPQHYAGCGRDHRNIDMPSFFDPPPRRPGPEEYIFTRPTENTIYENEHYPESENAPHNPGAAMAGLNIYGDVGSTAFRSAGQRHNDYGSDWVIPHITYEGDDDQLFSEWGRIDAKDRILGYESLDQPQQPPRGNPGVWSNYVGWAFKNSPGRGTTDPDRSLDAYFKEYPHEEDRYRTQLQWLGYQKVAMDRGHPWIRRGNFDYRTGNELPREHTPEWEEWRATDRRLIAESLGWTKRWRDEGSIADNAKGLPVRVPGKRLSGLGPPPGSKRIR